jgi:hypothetical protein
MTVAGNSTQVCFLLTTNYIVMLKIDIQGFVHYRFSFIFEICFNNVEFSRCYSDYSRKPYLQVLAYFA